MITIVLLLVGIGFVAVVTGAVAERFLATEFEEVAEATHEVEATEADVLAELREIKDRRRVLIRVVLWRARLHAVPSQPGR